MRFPHEFTGSLWFLAWSLACSVLQHPYCSRVLGTMQLQSSVAASVAASSILLQSSVAASVAASSSCSISGSLDQ